MWSACGSLEAKGGVAPLAAGQRRVRLRETRSSPAPLALPALRSSSRKSLCQRAQSVALSHLRIISSSRARVPTPNATLGFSSGNRRDRQAHAFEDTGDAPEPRLVVSRRAVRVGKGGISTEKGQGAFCFLPPGAHQNSTVTTTRRLAPSARAQSERRISRKWAIAAAFELPLCLPASA